MTEKLSAKIKKSKSQENTASHYRKSNEKSIQNKTSQYTHIKTYLSVSFQNRPSIISKIYWASIF
jgi:hypothetical protein